MLFWFLICLMLGAAVLFLLLPLARRNAPAATPYFEHDKQRIAELDKQLAANPADEALIAERTSTARQLLAMEDGGALPSARGTQFHRNAVSLLALIGIPVVALGVYSSLGEPGRSDVPLHAQLNKTGAQADMDAMVAKVERHLKANPDDAKGWTILARVYATSGRFAKRQQAIEQLIRLQGRRPDLLADLAEATIQIDGNMVPANARALLDEALAADPNNRKAAYYRTVAMEQSGQFEQALASWQKLAKANSDDGQWQAMVSQRIARLQSLSDKAPGQTSDQAEMIEGMVAGLRDRLLQDPTDIAGWERLLRSYAVLNRPADATQALETVLARDDLPAELRQKLTTLKETQERTTP